MVSTGPKWWWMSLSVSWLQLFLEQLLGDIWVLSPQGATLKHTEDYISTLWLQKTFDNFCPFSDHSFLSSSYSPLGLVCLIFSRDSSKTKSEPFPKTKSRLLLETPMARIENQHYRPWTSCLPDHQPRPSFISTNKPWTLMAPTSLSLFVYIP